MAIEVILGVCCEGKEDDGRAWRVNGHVFLMCLTHIDLLFFVSTETVLVFKQVESLGEKRERQKSTHSVDIKGQKKKSAPAVPAAGPEVGKVVAEFSEAFTSSYFPLCLYRS